MLALRKISSDPELVLEDIPKPEPAPHEVLVEVQYAGICRSDVLIRDNRHAYGELPFTLGHEFSGRIVDAGLEAQAEGWSPDDRVVQETTYSSCWKCYNCKAGMSQHCPDKKVLGIHVDGGFAKFVRVPARALHRIPDNVGFRTAAIVEPAAVCMYGITERIDGVRAGETVVVLGPGMLGLVSVQIAKLRGAGTIIVTGMPADQGRMHLARQLGADIAIDVTQEDPLGQIMHCTDGNGADAVIDTSGHPKAIAEGMKYLRRRGRFIAIGLTGKPEIPLPWDLMNFKAFDVVNCLSSKYTSWEKVLALASKGRLDLETLATYQFALEDWQQAFGMIGTENAVRVMLKP